MAVFAKALSNGYPMAAIVGRASVMEAAQDSFVSSTYWTESIGPTAALATITKMHAIDVAAHVERIGTQIQQGWRRLAAKHGLPLSVSGLPALTAFHLDHDDEKALITLFTQCMLDRGYLAGSYVYPTAAHVESIVDDYLAAADECFATVADAIAEGDVRDRLRGPVAHKGFQRLT